jgi:transcriptional regulator with GAF, ATPase, and Fis domain
MEIYRRAEEALRDSPRQTVQKRLREVSRKKLQGADSPLFSYAPTAPEKAEGESEKVNWKGFSLSRAVLEFEERHITLALKETGGLVSRAAQLLGLTHQNLSTQLQNRHRNLFHARKPPRRSRSDKLPKEPEKSGG